MLPDVDTVTLTYRQLAAELGISVVAARTRARRGAATGRWRIIEPNRRGAANYVQIPVADLADLTQTASQARATGRAERRAAPTSDPGSLDLAVIDTLRTAYRHIEDLHRAALLEKDQRRAAELRFCAAEHSKAQLQGQITQLEQGIGERDRQLAAVAAEKERMIAAMARLEAQEQHHAARALDLQSRIETLRRRLQLARTSWWKRPFLKRDG